jgi:hypothetical protein
MVPELTLDAVVLASAASRKQFRVETVLKISKEKKTWEEAL